MSKRKSPGALPDNRPGASGKQRVDELQEDRESGSDLLQDLMQIPDDSFPGKNDVGELDAEDDDDGEGDFVNEEADMLADISADAAAPPEEEEEESPDLPFDAEQLGQAEELDMSLISVPQARRIAPMLCDNRRLSVIHFAGHDLSVAELKDEEELEWDSEEFTDVEAIIIAEFLKMNASIKRLDLARNQISDDGASALAQALYHNQTLEYLNLEGNVVAEKGGAALSRAVQTNCTLQYLNLMYNAIPSAGQQELRDVW
eukprot:CAMPEP_0119310832 /NCGR_PEP_ID=MMETSP1333-20130426/20455_1 /TAXON_ID=418940 /ORGANISM="Scyphosphaera apsteinii, Strain RCC1455" /LENGTH=258 /DNA_ID=CAMNT_0007315085 /DNA_START=65 /DNA_END=838 /DNA_ORIENTATION=-